MELQEFVKQKTKIVQTKLLLQQLIEKKERAGLADDPLESKLVQVQIDVVNNSLPDQMQRYESQIPRIKQLQKKLVKMKEEV